MSDTKFTPGPWVIENGFDVFGPLGGESGDGIACDSNDGWQIAEVGDYLTTVNGELVQLGFGPQRANLALIAAAPELYGALTEIMALESRDRIMPMGDEWGRARSALAKARGEKS